MHVRLVGLYQIVRPFTCKNPYMRWKGWQMQRITKVLTVTFLWWMLSSSDFHTFFSLLSLLLYTDPFFDLYATENTQRCFLFGVRVFWEVIWFVGIMSFEWQNVKSGKGQCHVYIVYRIRWIFFQFPCTLYSLISYYKLLLSILCLFFLFFSSFFFSSFFPLNILQLLLLLYLCHPLYVKVDSHNTFGCGIHRSISINK
jgi:hypothetical protein